MTWTIRFDPEVPAVWRSGYRYDAAPEREAVAKCVVLSIANGPPQEPVAEHRFTDLINLAIFIAAIQKAAVEAFKPDVPQPYVENGVVGGVP